MRSQIFNMKLSNFNYDLPKELLAEYPSDQRDESRLMVLHRDSGKIEHKTFKDVIDYFEDGDSFVLNNTKVFPCLLYTSPSPRDAHESRMPSSA